MREGAAPAPGAWTEPRSQKYPPAAASASRNRTPRAADTARRRRRPDRVPLAIARLEQRRESLLQAARQRSGRQRPAIELTHRADAHQGVGQKHLLSAQQLL